MVVPNPIAKIQKISVSHEEYSENQRKHYLEHMQFDFGFIPNLRSTLIDVAEEIVKRAELDLQKFFEFRGITCTQKKPDGITYLIFMWIINTNAQLLFLYTMEKWLTEICRGE